MEPSQTTNIKMSQPQQQWWEPITAWLSANTILFIIAGLAWKFLDKIVEMWEKSQDARISRLIDAKLNPEIKKLSESIDDLKEAIWDLKKP
jgi:hypothetical protein